MANNRKTIRAAVKALLLNNTSAGANVFMNRASEFNKNELPAINISSGDESATQRDQTGRQYIRTFPLNIELKIEHNDTVDDELDDLASEVETLLASNSPLSAMVLKCVYQSSSLSINSDSEKDVGTLTLSYELQYIG